MVSHPEARCTSRNRFPRKSDRLLIGREAVETDADPQHCRISPSILEEGWQLTLFDRGQSHFLESEARFPEIAADGVDRQRHKCVDCCGRSAGETTECRERDQAVADVLVYVTVVKSRRRPDRCVWRTLLARAFDRAAFQGFARVETRQVKRFH